jgi:aminoacyl tRNA synthase complex-interacting multifunctional protein 1
MSAFNVAAQDNALSLLLSLGGLSITKTEPAPAVSQMTTASGTVSGTNTIASHLSSEIPVFSKIEYTDLEKAEIEQWLTLSAATPIADSTLDALNENLKFRTTLLGEKLSVADVVVYARVKDTVAAWSDEERTGEKGRRYIVRWVDFVQNTPALGLNIPADQKVAIDASKVLFTPKPEEAPKKEKKPAAGAAAAVEEVKKGAEAVAETAKEAGKKVKDAAGAAAAAAGKKTEKKQKPKREPAPPKEGTYHIITSYGRR